MWITSYFEEILGLMIRLLIIRGKNIFRFPVCLLISHVSWEPKIGSLETDGCHQPVLQMTPKPHWFCAGRGKCKL